MSERDPFYIGWEPRMAPSLARRTRRAVAIAALAAVAVALALAASQREIAPATFEFGHPRGLAGTIRERPYPALLVPRPGVPSGGISAYHLVAPGKHGAGPLVEGLDGRRVRLDGTLAYREADVLVELVPGSIEPAGPPEKAPAAEDLGMVVLRGEIVDGKCYLGVMNPGEGKPHRGCAARCISGGIPPLLVARDREGNRETFLLAAADGGAVGTEILPFVGEPVEVRGRLLRDAGRLILRADPGGYRRLGGQDPEGAR